MAFSIIVYFSTVINNLVITGCLSTTKVFSSILGYPCNVLDCIKYPLNS